MKTFIVQIAVFLVLAEARVHRSAQREDMDFEDDPEGIDVSTLGNRQERPSGFEAGLNERDQRQAFLAWTSSFGKHYKNTAEMDERIAAWKTTNSMIRENNLRSERSGLPNAPYMDHNIFSDWTQAEKDKLLGLKDGVEFNVEEDEPIEADDRRHLADFNEQEVYWGQEIVGPVLNQGACGSCWAFSALAPLEAAIAIKTGEPWKPLSKQHLVDCTFIKKRKDLKENHGIKPGLAKNYGCDGGRMDWSYNFLRKHGAMYEGDYPYTSGLTVEEGECMHEPTLIDKRVKDYSLAPMDPYAIREQLNKAPMAVTMAFGNGLMSYSSGVIPAGDETFCSGRLNHALTLVGYNQGINQQVQEKTITTCRRRFKKDKPECRFEGEFVWRNRYCCKTEEATAEISEGANWTIQNQWGTNWGESGFLRAAFSEGAGVCGMNMETWSVSHKDM